MTFDYRLATFPDCISATRAVKVTKRCVAAHGGAWRCGVRAAQFVKLETEAHQPCCQTTSRSCTSDYYYCTLVTSCTRGLSADAGLCGRIHASSPFTIHDSQLLVTPVAAPRLACLLFGMDEIERHFASVPRSAAQILAVRERSDVTASNVHAAAAAAERRTQ